MSGSVNKVIIVGNLGRDPEIRATQSGKRVANLTVATSENWKDKATGERKERTEWHRVVIFNDGLVDVADKYLKKGARIYLEGALRTRKWIDNGGQERYTTEIELQPLNGVLTMLGGASGSGGGTDRGYHDRAEEQGSVHRLARAARPATVPMGGDVPDDDIPF